MGSEKKKIIQEFLKCPYNKTLFEEFQSTNSEEAKQKIDLKFKKYYQNYRILSYLIKVLHYESKHFDHKIRTYKHRYQLIVTNDLETPIFFEKSYSDSIDCSKDIEDHISNEKLFTCFKTLTARQKEILSLVYVRQMTDKEIAQYLGITQQAVSKTRKNVLKKIRKGITHD